MDSGYTGIQGAFIVRFSILSHVHAVVVPVAFVLSFLGCGGDETQNGGGGAGGTAAGSAGADAGGESCSMDTQCKDDRICVDGRCVSPDEAAGTGGSAAGVGGSAAGVGGSEGGESGGGNGGSTAGAGGTGSCADVPDTPSGPSPADAATDLDHLTVTGLDWDDAAGAVSYDVYLGSCPVPDYPNESYQNVTSPELTGLSLEDDTEYCWKVVAIDAEECISEGPAWAFHTAVCNDPSAGAPGVVSGVAYFSDCTVAGVYTLLFDEAVRHVDTANLTWSADTGSGTLGSITEIDAATYEVAFSGTAAGDSYTLTVGTGIEDSCGTAVETAEEIDIFVGATPAFFYEDFEAMTADSVPDAQDSWASAPSSTALFSWRVNSGPTDSSGTGPLADHTSRSGNFVFTEANDGASSDTTELISPSIDLSAALSPELSFYYHMYGTGTGTLGVEVNAGAGYTNLWSLSGQQQTADTDPWRKASVDLSSYAGNTITIRFVGTKGADYLGDMAIDDVLLSEAEVPAPETDFDVSSSEIGFGKYVRLTDQSTGTPTSWLWNFNGPGAPIYGSTYSETDPDTEVGFDTAGTYTIELQASNAYGTCSLVRADALQVIPYCPVGHGTQGSPSLPLEPFYGYSYSQSIYLASELCGPSTIETISWEYNGGAASTELIDVYLGHTSETAFSSETDWIPVGSLTLVYSGNLVLTTTAGFVTVTLDTPFAYNGTSNLVVAVDRNTGAYSLSSADFYSQTIPGEIRSIIHHADSTNADPASPPAGMGYNMLPNARFD